jgi:hypothetical protein
MRDRSRPAFVELARRDRRGGDRPFVVVDMTFFSANLLKLLEGAWVPLLFGFAMAILIWTWRRGSAILIIKTPADRSSAQGSDQEPRKAPAAHRQGHRGFSDQRPELRADGAPA